MSNKLGGNDQNRVTWVAFLCVCSLNLALGEIAHSSEPRILSPEFAVPTQSFMAPVQTGSARLATVKMLGLYQLPEDVAQVYCLGKLLPVLPNRLLFLRTVDDFYAGGNVVWTGAVNVDGASGVLPPPAIEAHVRDGGAFAARFRTEENKAFQYNHYKPPAPNWYFPKPFDVIGVRKDAQGEKHPNPVTVEVTVMAPAAQGQALLRVALNSNAAKGKGNTLGIGLNGVEITGTVAWQGPGYRIIEQDFDASLLRDGKNSVELLGDASYIKYLDWVEIVTPAQPELRDGRLVVEAQADAPLCLSGVRYAMDITDWAAERTLKAIDGADNTYNLERGRIYYFADHFDTLNFGGETVLAEAKIEGSDYVCVGMRAMLPALEPLLNLKKAQGLQTASVAFEDLVNVYNGGVYGPNAIMAFLERFKPEYLLLAGGFHRDCRGRRHTGSPDAPWHPGIPAEMRHVDQLTVSDDCYTLGNTIKVGRVPLRTPAELAAWAAKATHHTPPDSLVLLAGENKKADFSAYQRSHMGKVPAALLAADGRPQEETRDALFELMRSGRSLVVFQGHAQSWELDKGLLDTSHADAMPSSSWVLATCNAAYYHADYEVYLRDWMASPEGGCINTIAASSVGADDQQDQLVRRFVENAQKNPEEDWGGMMRYLKKNLPFIEKTMNDPNIPGFIKNTIPEARKTIDVYSLLGDPAARVLAAPRREAVIARADGEAWGNFLPLGPAALSLTLSGPWDEEALASGRVVLQWRMRNENTWKSLPLDTPLRIGPNPFPFDSAALGHDGGFYQLRTAEQHPCGAQTVWAITTLRQDSSKPGIPEIRFRKTPPRAAAPVEPQPAPAPDARPAMLMCIAREQGPALNRKAYETQFQLRDAGKPEEIIEDTGWQTMSRHLRALEETPATLEIRARFRKHGNESAWSAWTPMVLPRPQAAGKTAQ